MKIGIVALLVLVTGSPAMANPQPLGKCSLIDDGVRMVSTNHDKKTSHDPNILSMIMPPVLGNSVVDVAFHINADGTVVDTKVLCISNPGSGIEATILSASKKWRFSPMMLSGKAIATDAAYRVSASGVIPLTFNPELEVRHID